jgi:flagellar hook protein FlgE
MYSAIGSMQAEQTKLDVIANNIANVSTTAFKSSIVNFSDTLYQSMASTTAPTTTLGGTNAKTVGLGSEVASINKSMSQGSALTTGRSADVCIDGDGYLIIAKGSVDSTISTSDTESSTPVEQVYYTRDGNLTLDEDGYLLTSDGYRVMGYRTNEASYDVDSDTGEATILSGAETSDNTTYNSDELYAMTIPTEVNESAVSSYTIGSDGVITAITGTGNYVIGQIGMATFLNTEGLTDLGGNLAEESTNSGTAIIRNAADIGSTDTGYNAGAFGSIEQGYLEASNVDLTEQFTDMISATKAFQASSKMITNGSEILDTIVALIR